MDVYLLTNDSQEMCYVVKLAFKVIINEKKYEAMLAGLLITHSMEAIEVLVHRDSYLVVQQRARSYNVKGDKLEKNVQRV